MGDPKDEEACPVIAAWMNIPLLVSRASVGQIATVKKELDRQDVSDNADLLEPLIRCFGAVVRTYRVINSTVPHSRNDLQVSPNPRYKAKHPADE